MAGPRLDPYETLGVSPTASDAEVRGAYRRLVQLHHPDHNGGSAASTRRFEEIQEAYAQVRKRSPSAGRESTTRARPAPPRPGPSSPPDPRLADMEREVREAHLARERARQAAREAAAQSYERASDDELGYIKTDDSLGKILADARAQASERFSEAREPVTKRVADLLDDLAAKLNGDGPPRPRK
ncbi:MAG TPA: J domain-containing protein [Solirubrobacteraceae bacterium]|jgi:curved DNA-binding protein CbpA|nr:J domain-containing protein [Solirubrobacteraceae bacterium]